MVLSSCLHDGKNRDDEFDFRIRQVEHITGSHGYMLDIDRCSIDYLMCRDAGKRTNCWSSLENCVKVQYDAYQLLKKKLKNTK